MVAIVEELVDWKKVVQYQIDAQQAAKQIEVLMDLVDGLVFEIALQSTAQALVAAL